MAASPDDTIYVATRTGKKLHKASPGSSVTRCGHWLRVDSRQMKVDVTEADLGRMALVLCEHCFSPGERLVPAADAVTPTTVREVTDLKVLAGYTEGTDLLAQQARFQAAYLLRTMSTQDLFMQLGRFPDSPKLQALVNKTVKERSS